MRIRRRRLTERAGAAIFAVVAASAAFAQPAPLEPFQETRMDDRIPLARLVEPTDPETARLIRAPETSVRRLPTAFLPGGMIFRAEWRGPNRPVTWTIGYARAGNCVVFLSANPDGFRRLIEKAGVTLDTDEQRVSYAVTLLETTRRFDETFKVLRDFRDLRPMANPGPEQAARLKAIAAKWRPLIRPPQSEPDAGGWKVPVNVLHRNDLCLFVVSIDRSGGNTVTSTVLEANAPLLPTPD